MSGIAALGPAELRRLAAELRQKAVEADRAADNLMLNAGTQHIVPLHATAWHRHARFILQVRRKISDFFDHELFADPARDILLDLFVAAEEGQPVSVSSCCIAACVPPTTALRWIAKLQQSGLVRCQDDPSDQRRRLVTISAEGRKAMRAYLAAVASIPPAEGGDAYSAR